MSNEHKRNLAVPFFTQRDNTYIWQQKYEKDKYDEITGKKIEEKDKPFGSKYPMAWRTCNITSLCMILHYWGLTEETPNQMIENIFAKKKESEGKNVKWGWNYEEYCRDTVNKIYKGAARIEVWENLKNIAELYIEGKEGYKIVQGGSNLTLKLLQDQISNGYPVIISTGLGSLYESGETDGHIVVVRGFTDSDDVILNDPFGIPVDVNNSLNNGNYGSLIGCYYNSPAAAIGDNIIINKDDFLANYAKNTPKYLYIEGPLWQEPGGKETDISNSYPIRSNNMWHDGIHLESSNGFYSIGSGRLIAARNAEVEKHGSNSFALVKYQLPNQEKKFFYALYMHLKKIDLKKELEDFFLKNNGTVSENLRNTWYEQIFNNLLPTYCISYYSEKSLTSGQQEDIFEAEIVNKKLRIKTINGNPIKAKLDDSNIGIESRHMKYYMIPHGKLDILCDIENYRNISNLKFMIKGKASESADFVKDGYMFFYCGNNYNRKLCCIKKETFNVAENWQVYNEASYKYYSEILYKLYNGETIIFNKISTEAKNDKLKKIDPKKVIENSILSFNPTVYPNSKFLLGVHNKSGYAANPIEILFSSVKHDIQSVINDIEYIFIAFTETGKTASKTDLENYIDNYKTKRQSQLEGFLKEITRVTEIKNVEFGSIEKKTAAEWMKELFEDAETKIGTEKLIAKKGSYDVTKGMQSMREEFKKILDEYKNADLITSIAICEFLMIEFASLPKEKLTKDDDRFKFESFSTENTFPFLYRQWSDAFVKLKNFYITFFNQRYIDNYIEMPKGVKIGYGSLIPDGKKNNSIHLEIFSEVKLITSEYELEDKDDDNFYNPSEITKKIISTLNMTDTERCQYMKYAEDNVITKDEIGKLYTQTEYFQKMVTYHRSEWKNKQYNENDISAITNKKTKIIDKNEIINTLDYYNDYYSKYNWDKNLEKKLESDKFYYYHPIYFIKSLLDLNDKN